jgi:feruloyl esterase
MGHCLGGDQTLDDFNMLEAIVDWVEQGKAPESVIATGKSMPDTSRPLCAYPHYAAYSGKGSINAAENYSCK